jgi:hypothetical protein
MTGQTLRTSSSFVVVLVLETLCSLSFVEHEDEDRYAEDEDDLSPYL